MLSPYLPHQKPPLWAIDPGIVAYNASKMGLSMSDYSWSIWEAGGNKIYSVGKQQLIGTFVNSPIWQSTSRGIGIDFVNASAQYIQLDSKIVLVDNTPWTISTLVYLDELADYRGIYGNEFQAGKYTRLMLRATGGAYLRNDANTGDMINAGVFSVGWQHIILVCDGSNASNIKIFVNGLLKDTLTLADSSQTIYRLASIGDLTTNTFDGRLLTFDMWDGVGFTSSQVATLSADPYGLVRQPSMEELWAYYEAVVGVAPTGVFYGPLYGPLGGPA